MAPGRHMWRYSAIFIFISKTAIIACIFFNGNPMSVNEFSDAKTVHANRKQTCLPFVPEKYPDALKI
jgi:hypothetical protein